MSCRECFQGHVHEGSLKGTETKLHGLDVYVAEPPAGTEVTGIVIIIPDVFGWSMANTRLVADRYALKSSYRVYLPDFMNGHAIEPELLPTFKTVWAKDVGILLRIPAIFSLVVRFIPFTFHCRFSVITPRMVNFIQALKTDTATSSLPIGAAGFCWGGKSIFQLCADVAGDRVDGKPLLDAGFTAHPSALSLPADTLALRRPLSVANGDLDMLLSVAQLQEMKKELEGRPEAVGPDGKERGEVRIYQGVGHGFAVRGDMAVENVAVAAEQAEDQALAWFRGNFER